MVKRRTLSLDQISIEQAYCLFLEKIHCLINEKNAVSSRLTEITLSSSAGRADYIYYPWHEIHESKELMFTLSAQAQCRSMIPAGH